MTNWTITAMSTRASAPTKFDALVVARALIMLRDATRGLGLVRMRGPMGESFDFTNEGEIVALLNS